MLYLVVKEPELRSDGAHPMLSMAAVTSKHITAANFFVINLLKNSMIFSSIYYIKIGNVIFSIIII